MRATKLIVEYGRSPRTFRVEGAFVAIFIVIMKNVTVTHGGYLSSYYMLAQNHLYKTIRETKLTRTNRRVGQLSPFISFNLLLRDGISGQERFRATLFSRTLLLLLSRTSSKVLRQH